VDEHRAANRANWDERTPTHVRSGFYDVEGWLRDERGPRPREVAALGDVTGLRLVHLQCHFGVDTLAWARAGATVTGLDFSPVAIEAAVDLARRAGLAARSTFVCADVLDAASALAPQQFDIVYVSLGSLGWLPSVGRWADQVAALLVTGGRLYLHDGHPLSAALAVDSLEIERSYFEEPEPFVEEASDTYTGDGGAVTSTTTYEWNHSLGEIVGALVRNGLVVDALDEHDWTVWRRYDWLVEADDDRWSVPAGRPRIPLSFTLLAHKA
jgi:SAM-dependent methyltransferase